MKKVKVVLSDLHIGKGRVLKDGSMNIFEEFYYDEKIAEFLDYYSTAEFEEAEVEVVLNGDILNLLQVDYKGHFLTALTETIECSKVRECIEGHPEIFEALRRFTSKPHKKISYIVGNHDQGMLWPAARKIFDEACGTRVNFVNIVYRFDGIHIEHGHQHEAANRIDPKKFFLKQDLAEPILNLPWASHFVVNFVIGLKFLDPHIDKVRPFHSMVRWRLMNNFFETMVWIFKLLKFFFLTGVSRDPRLSFPVRKTFAIVKEGAIFPNLEYAAKAILQNDPKRVHTVIFGHTHVYMYRQWGRDKEYINTGTWTELVSLDLASLGKITKLTYVLIEYPDDGGRPRARLREWRGHHKVELDVAV